MKRPNIPCTCKFPIVCPGCLAFEKYERYLAKKRRWRKDNPDKAKAADHNSYLNLKVNNFAKYEEKLARSTAWNKTHRDLCNKYVAKSRKLRSGI
mgnify:FL=1